MNWNLYEEWSNEIDELDRLCDEEMRACSIFDSIEDN